MVSVTGLGKQKTATLVVIFAKQLM